MRRHQAEIPTLTGASAAHLTLPAYAKVNLVLAVGPRRPDGYHELTTLFERVSLADTLTLTLQPHTITCTCTHPQLQDPQANLVVRAAVRLRDRAGVSAGVQIRLTKRIPVTSGLGGGSSDAAAVLRGLNVLWGLRWPIERLCEVGAELGADVPFFLWDAPRAIGRGRGDHCELLPRWWPAVWYLIAVPPVELRSGDIYKQFSELEENSSEDTPRQQRRLTAAGEHVSLCTTAMIAREYSRLAAGLSNSLERAIAVSYPDAIALKTFVLQHGALGALVSGSGPAIFGVATSRRHAAEIKRALERAHPALATFITHTI